MQKEIPPFDPNTFDGANWQRYCNDGTHLGTGTDSTADRVHPDWVLKRYKKHMTLSLLRFYDQFMRELGVYVIGRQFQVGVFGTLTLAVEPIYRMFQAPNSLQVMAISRYKNGKHFGAGKNTVLDEFFKAFSQEVMRDLEYSGVEISTPNSKFCKVNMGMLYRAHHLCTITDGCNFITHLKKSR